MFDLQVKNGYSTSFALSAESHNEAMCLPTIYPPVPTLDLGAKRNSLLKASHLGANTLWLRILKYRLSKVLNIKHLLVKDAFLRDVTIPHLDLSHFAL